MLLLVTIDLSHADLDIFNRYEAQVLPRLAPYGGHILHRLRAADSRSEFHLLSFPDPQALSAFQADPVRQSLQPMWANSGASATLTHVTPQAS